MIDNSNVISNVIIYESDDYEVSLINRGSKKLVFVFASAGSAFGGAPVKEFKNSIFSLENKDFDICWIIDKKVKWFSSVNNIDLINALNSLAETYSPPIAIGESMGGSAALFFSRDIKLKRLLVLGPQFSMRKPFINFNAQLGPPDFRDIVTAQNYASTSSLINSFLFFGAESWQDFIHASFFKEFGYHVKFIRHAGHTVAHTLKSLNLLLPLLECATNSEVTNDEFVVMYENLLHDVVLDRPSVKIFNLLD
jgi:hypothetical protein